ncbi:MAG TPA: methyltransferase domain-containing protein [Candidatus Dojkabacteria bacterium]|jgi:SAM-dependent methyltransferase
MVYFSLWIWTIHESDVLRHTSGIREEQIFPLYGHDSLEYETISRNILNGNGFSRSRTPPFLPDTVRTPGYPLLVAGLLETTGSLFSVTLLSIVFVLTIAIMIYKLTESLTESKKLGFICSLFFILDPAVIIFGLTIYNDVLFALIAFLAFWLVFVKTKDSIWRLATAGMLLGFLVLVKPSGTYLILLIPALFFALYRQKFGSKKSLIFAFVCLVTSLLIISPWVIRNKIKTESVHVSSIIPGYLYTWYIPRFEAWRSNADFITHWLEHGEEYQKEHKMTLEESARPENSSRAIAVFIENFLNDPIKNIQFYFTESRYFLYAPSASLFSLTNLQYNRFFTDGEWKEPLPLWVMYVEKYLRFGMLGLAIIGLWIGRRNKIIIASGFMFFYLWLVTGPIPTPRLRIHAEPFLLVLAGVGASQLFNMVKIGRSTSKQRNGSFAPEKLIDKILHRWRCAKVYPFVKEGIVVCDLGCSMRADLLKKIEGWISRGIGIDFKVDKNLEGGKIELITSDLNATLPLEDESADLVTSMAVLEHLHDYRGFTGETYRILKDGGKLIVSTPTQAADPILRVLSFFSLINKEEIDDHKRYFNKRQLTDLFREVGFKNIKVNYFQFGFNQLITAEK